MEQEHKIYRLESIMDIVSMLELNTFIDYDLNTEFCLVNNKVLNVNRMSISHVDPEDIRLVYLERSGEHLSGYRNLTSEILSKPMIHIRTR